jgi:hypothetical protein
MTEILWSSAGRGVRPVDPATLSWQVLLDSRNIPTSGNGSTIHAWVDTSGFTRPAVEDIGSIALPVYRPNSSARGLPLVDFGAVPNSQLVGVLPVTPMDTSAGFSCYAYYLDDTVDATDGGGFNAQMIGGSDIAGGWRAFAVLYPTASNPVPSEPQNTLNTGVPATVGRHILTAVWNPPVVTTSTANLYYDGINIATSSVTIPGPNTKYLVSGNGSANIILKGRLGFFAFTNVTHSPAVRQGIEAYLLSHFG